jgi:hypothetical protein
MKRVAVALVALLVVAGCGGGEKSTTAGGAAVSADVVDVDGIEPVKAQFLADAGRPRLLVFLSPT